MDNDSKLIWEAYNTPYYAYHFTSPENVENIRQNGIQPTGSGMGDDELVFLSPSDDHPGQMQDSVLLKVKLDLDDIFDLLTDTYENHLKGEIANTPEEAQQIQAVEDAIYGRISDEEAVQVFYSLGEVISEMPIHPNRIEFPS